MGELPFWQVKQILRWHHELKFSPERIAKEMDIPLEKVNEVISPRATATSATPKIEKIEDGLWIIVKGFPPAALSPKEVTVPAFAYKEEAAKHIAKGLAPCYIYQLKYSVTGSNPAVYIEDVDWYGEKLPLYAFAGDLAVKAREGYFISVSETSKISERELPKHLMYLKEKHGIKKTWQEILDKLYESVGSSETRKRVYVPPEAFVGVVTSSPKSSEYSSATLKPVIWHGIEYFAYGSLARPLEWLTIKDVIKSVPYPALTRLSRSIDYGSAEPYFNIILSPRQFSPEEIKALELTRLEKLPTVTPSESSSFHVRYIDLTSGRTVEKTIPDREQHDLYKLQREGKISIIEIHKV